MPQASGGGGGGGGDGGGRGGEGGEGGHVAPDRQNRGDPTVYSCTHMLGSELPTILSLAAAKSHV